MLAGEHKPWSTTPSHKRARDAYFEEKWEKKLNLNMSESDVDDKQKQSHKSKHKVRDTINSSYIMTFLCLLLFSMSAACFWRAETYFQELNQRREETTGNCHITNFTIYQCRYDCNHGICNGTGYLFEAISTESCGNQVLLENEDENAVCPQEKITDIGLNEVCWIIDCNQGFHLFPPYKLVALDPAGVIWITVGFIIGVCGAWCLLYACGEYITSLGTYDFEPKWAMTPNGRNQRKRRKCCNCRRNRRH